MLLVLSLITVKERKQPQNGVEGVVKMGYIRDLFSGDGVDLEKGELGERKTEILYVNTNSFRSIVRNTFTSSNFYHAFLLVRIKKVLTIAISFFIIIIWK